MEPGLVDIKTLQTTKILWLIFICISKVMVCACVCVLHKVNSLITGVSFFFFLRLKSIYIPCTTYNTLSTKAHPKTALNKCIKQTHVGYLEFGNCFCLHISVGMSLKLSLLGKGKVFSSCCAHDPADSATPRGQGSITNQHSPHTNRLGVLTCPVLRPVLPSPFSALTH